MIDSDLSSMSLSHAYARSKALLSASGIDLAGKKLLLAVSGGKDSMCMLRMLGEAGLSVEVAHMNFGLRGADAEADAVFVRQTCGALQITLHEKTVNAVQDRLQGESVQVTARRLRYIWFEELQSRYGFDWICTAHHLDDSIETFFVNLLRGSGLKGLCGIPIVRDHIVRPMLCFRRSEIEALVLSNQIAYREDASNAEGKYLRNRVRHEIIPAFLREHPAFQQRMEDTFERLKSEHALLDHSLHQILHQVSVVKQNDLHISISELQKTVSPVSVLHHVLQRFGFQWRQCKAILQSPMTTGSKYLSGSHIVIADREVLAVKGIQQYSTITELTIENTGEYQLPEGTLTIHKCRLDEMQFHRDPSFEYVSEIFFQKDVVLRKWQPGDVIHPYGIKGTQKVQDYFVNEKLSMTAKAEAWILTSGGEIVWIAGMRLDRRFAVGESDQMCYRLAWTRHQ